MAQNTRSIIMASFMRIVSGKPLDKITVKDIVEDCQITRNTFYYHFQDIYDLAAEVFRTEFAAIIRRRGAAGDWFGEVQAIAEFAQKNRSATLHIYRSARRQELLRVCGAATDQYLLAALAELPGAAHLPPDSLQLLVYTLRCALLGMGQDWLDRGMKEPPGPMLEHVRPLFDGAIAAAFAAAGHPAQRQEPTVPSKGGTAL